jgi:hypothetical protein
MRKRRGALYAYELLVELAVSALRAVRDGFGRLVVGEVHPPHLKREEPKTPALNTCEGLGRGSRGRKITHRAPISFGGRRSEGAVLMPGEYPRRPVWCPSPVDSVEEVDNRSLATAGARTGNPDRPTDAVLVSFGSKPLPCSG